MEEEFDSMPSSLGDFRKLFPDFTPELITELTGLGFAEEKDIMVANDEEDGEGIFAKGVSVQFKGRGETYLKIDVDKQTGHTYSVDQMVNLPISMHSGVKSWFEMYYSNFQNSAPFFRLRFASGDIFQNIPETEGLLRLDLSYSTYHDVGAEEAVITDDGFIAVFQGSKLIQIEAGYQNIKQQGQSNIYPASLFFRDKNPWKVALIDDGEGKKIFNLVIPGVMEVSGDYKLELIPNPLELFKQGLEHRPIIKFRSQMKMLK
jgi:hypothetical protein